MALTASRVKKWRFPWKEHELELLGAQLEKLKSVLSLLMNVLMHARMLKQEYVRASNIQRTPELIVMKTCCPRASKDCRVDSCKGRGHNQVRGIEKNI